MGKHYNQLKNIFKQKFNLQKFNLDQFFNNNLKTINSMNKDQYAKLKSNISNKKGLTNDQVECLIDEYRNGIQNDPHSYTNAYCRKQASLKTLAEIKNNPKEYTNVYDGSLRYNEDVHLFKEDIIEAANYSKNEIKKDGLSPLSDQCATQAYDDITEEWDIGESRIRDNKQENNNVEEENNYSQDNSDQVEDYNEENNEIEQEEHTYRR